MNMRLGKRFRATVATLVELTWALSILLGLLVVIPLFLWSAWAGRTELANSILVLVFCLSFGWLLLSLTLCFRSLKKLGLDGEGSMRLFSGPRPDDPDELRAWQLGWQFMYGVMAVILSMIAIPVYSWLTGK